MIMHKTDKKKEEACSTRKAQHAEKAICDLDTKLVVGRKLPM